MIGGVGHILVEIEHSLGLGEDHVGIGIELVQLVGGIGGLVAAAGAGVGEAALADHQGLVVLLGQAGDGPHQGQGVRGVQAPAIVGVVAIGRRVKGIGGSLSGVGAVLIVGHADPVHILVAGIELGNGVVPVTDRRGGEHRLDVGILMGLGGDLLECLNIRGAVDGGPVVHLRTDA